MTIRRVSYRRTGSLLPRRPRGLRAGSVALTAGGVMDWHSTNTREELLVALGGRLRVEVLAPARRHASRARRIALAAGECLYLPRHTRHRVLNVSRKPARYLYVTAPAA